MTAETTDDRRRAALETIARVIGRPAAELRPEQYLIADLGIDSPELLRLLVELEERLGVEIDDEEAAALATVGDVLDYVGRP